MPKIKDFVLSYVSIIISIISSLIMLPLYIHYFGSEDYGAWIVINTFIQYLALANFGLPTSLTIIASNFNNKNLIRPLFYRSLKIISTIVALVLVLFLIGVKTDLVKPETFFGETDKKVFYFSCLIFSFILYCLRSPIQLASCIFLAVGKVYLNKIYEIMNNLTIPLSFLGLYFFGGNIMTYIIVSGILLLIIAITSFVHAKHIFNEYNALGIIQVATDEQVPNNKSILKLSAGYFIISIGAALVWNTDNLVIAHFLPLSEVTSYSITFRIYTTAFLVFNTINGVLLPYYGIYKSKNRFDLMQKSFKNSMFISSFLAGIIWVLTFLFSKDIILFWTRDPELYAGKYLFLILGGYGFILSLLSTISTLYASMKIVKVMIFITFAEGLTNLLVSLLLVKEYGLYGIAIGTFVGALTGLLIICILFDRFAGEFVKLPIKIILSNLLLAVSGLSLILFFSVDQYNLLVKVLISIGLSVSFAFITLKINKLKLQEFRNVNDD